MKVLVAEDDLVSQKILQHALEGSDYEVLLAADGEEAWHILLSRPIHVVVSDWMMPKVDGLDLCRRVRARRQNDYVYFILQTARSSPEDYHKAMDAGVDDFLAKPLRKDELLIRLRVARRLLTFMGQLRDLRRLLPICSYCKRVRDDKDYWHQIEAYIHTHTGADFSHSVCPDCYQKVIRPQLEAEGLEQSAKPGFEHGAKPAL